MYFLHNRASQEYVFLLQSNWKDRMERNGYREMPSAGYSESKIAVEAGRGPAERGRKNAAERERLLEVV